MDSDIEISSAKLRMPTSIDNTRTCNQDKSVYFKVSRLIQCPMSNNLYCRFCFIVATLAAEINFRSCLLRVYSARSVK